LGYVLRNRFIIQFEKSAARDLEGLPESDRRNVLKEIERYLTVDPFTILKTRIKKLHHLRLPLYRLRVGDYRVYYRIYHQAAVVMAVLNRRDSDRWLKSL